MVIDMNAEDIDVNYNIVYYDTIVAVHYTLHSTFRYCDDLREHGEHDEHCECDMICLMHVLRSSTCLMF